MNKKKLYILVCISCQSCSSRSVGLFKEKPTERQIKNAENLIGGMFCINSFIYKLGAGEITEIEE